MNSALKFLAQATFHVLLLTDLNKQKTRRTRKKNLEEEKLEILIRQKERGRERL